MHCKEFEKEWYGMSKPWDATPSRYSEGVKGSRFVILWRLVWKTPIDGCGGPSKTVQIKGELELYQPTHSLHGAYSRVSKSASSGC